MEVEVGGVEEKDGVEVIGAADDNPLEAGPATVAATGDEIGGDGAGAYVLAAGVEDVLTVHHRPLVASINPRISSPLDERVCDTPCEIRCNGALPLKYFIFKFY